MLPAVVFTLLMAFPSVCPAEKTNDPAAVTRTGETTKDVSSIVIRGNKALTTRTLEAQAAEELTAFRTKGFRMTDVDDAAYEMEMAYRNAGYRFATVDYQVAPVEGEAAALLFVVTEGPLVRVEGIVFSGNSRIATETLQSFMTARPGSPFVEASITSAVEEMRDYYYALGYLTTVIAPPRFTFSEDRSRVHVSIDVNEGVPYHIAEVLFTGDILPGARKDLEALRSSLIGLPFFPRRKMILESRLSEIYADLGHPEAEIHIEWSSDQETGATTLNANIQSGSEVRVSEIRITGNVKTRDDFIRNRVTLLPGERFTETRKRESFRNLYRTGLFSSVRIDLAEAESPGLRAVEVDVTELSSREAYAEAGWGSYETLRGKLGYREKNLFGTGKIVNASVAASFKSMDLTLGFTEPALLGSDVVLDVPLFFRQREEPSFSLREVGLSPTLSRRFPNRKVNTSLGYVIRITEQSNVDLVAEDAGRDYNLGSIKAQVSRDTRDDIFFPGSGYRSAFAAEVADLFLGSTVSFVRVTTTNRFFYRVADPVVLAFRYDSGFILPTRKQVTLPIGERFFNGGESSVRSFKEAELGPRDPESGDPVGGYAYNVLSLELRYHFMKHLAGSLFVDYGNLSPNRSRSERGRDPFDTQDQLIAATWHDYFLDFRPAVGIGFQYLLPVGPLRLDLAANPSADRKRDEREYTLHFTVGMAF